MFVGDAIHYSFGMEIEYFKLKIGHLIHIKLDNGLVYKNKSNYGIKVNFQCLTFCPACVIFSIVNYDFMHFFSNSL